MYEYRMVQLGEEPVAGSRFSTGTAANYLANVVGEQAAEGWEFYRVDSFSLTSRGCLNTISFGLLGQVSTEHVYVATFRRSTE